jgi:septum formation protein
VVIVDGRSLGKPRCRQEALEFLRLLRGRAHDVVTAVALVDTVSGRMESDAERTEVVMRAYGEQEMAEYADSGDGLDKAGGYAIQSATFRPVASIRGSHSNVVGLPVALVERLLAAFDTPDAGPLSRGSEPGPAAGPGGPTAPSGPPA